MRNTSTACRAILALLSFAWLACAMVSPALAGGVPGPLQAELDLASRVVVGQLVHLEETDELAWRGEHERWAIATVSVRETLKGPATLSASFLVASWTSPSHLGSSPPRVHRIGEVGIWVVMPGEKEILSHSYGLLPEKSLDTVRRMLGSLTDREWSDEVGGLKAWAGVVHHYDVYRGATVENLNPVIIFAVKNVSAVDILCPTAHRSVMAIARSQTGQVYELDLSTGLSPSSSPVFCRKLASNETVYLHWAHSSIDLSRSLKPGGPPTLPPGRYTVWILYRNSRDGVASNGPGSQIAVNAWKGSLAAPPVDITLSPPAKMGSGVSPVDQSLPQRLKR